MKNSIDIVFVANTKNSALWSMTRNAIKTARDKPGFPIGKIIVIEQNRRAAKYPDAKTVNYDIPFNYNWCLNLGFTYCESQYIAFCNNDVYFENHWARNAVRAMHENDLLSVCPSNKRHEFKGIVRGHKVGTHILGWCIITDRKVFDYIGQFDYPVQFWYSDNVYALQLQLAGIKHALVGDSRVRHLKSQTLTKIKGDQRKHYMRQQEKLFNQYKVKKYAEANAKIQAEKSDSN